MEKIKNSEIIIFKTEDEKVTVDVRFEDETAWLTQDQMAVLFGKGRSTITEHIRNIFAEGELQEKVVCRDFRHTTPHGAMAGKTQENLMKFYIQFPIRHAVRAELNWTHYRSLIRVENPKAREVYMNEAADNGWSTRFLDEQVDKHYYERLIVTHKEATTRYDQR